MMDSESSAPPQTEQKSPDSHTAFQTSQSDVYIMNTHPPGARTWLPPEPVNSQKQALCGSIAGDRLHRNRALSLLHTMKEHGKGILDSLEIGPVLL